MHDPSRLKDKLELFLAARGEQGEVVELTADASTREYFRVRWQGGTAVACVYPEGFDADSDAYLDVTAVFRSGGLPVAQILDHDAAVGIIVQEDLGDRVLRNILLESTRNDYSWLMNEAISLIARIQTLTGKAFEMNSIAARRTFDVQKLRWELDFFKTHYFETYRNQPLSTVDGAALDAEFDELAKELAGRARVLCHRDFHTANLMIDGEDRMRIIDHQDARIGSPTYDLVSLLLDRITELPSPEWLAERRRYFLDVRRRLGLSKIDEEEFGNEFRLQTIQRCLKAAGTFSYQSAVRGKTYFVPFIKPMFGISRRGAESLGRFPAIQEILSRELDA
jgi:aminoglycoside/choline kinase family phosphotransferase